MPSAVLTRPDTHAIDDLDDLFNYDAGMDEIMDGSRTNDRTAEVDPVDQDNANMDEEVKVTRKRQPTAKLDEERWIHFGLS